MRFTATASGSDITYLWNFDDGSATAPGSVVTHTYALSGTYTAAVTATNTLGMLTTTTPVTITGVIIQYFPLILKNYEFP